MRFFRKTRDLAEVESDIRALNWHHGLTPPDWNAFKPILKGLSRKTMSKKYMSLCKAAHSNQEIDDFFRKPWTKRSNNTVKLMWLVSRNMLYIERAKQVVMQLKVTDPITVDFVIILNNLRIEHGIDMHFDGPIARETETILSINPRDMSETNFSLSTSSDLPPIVVGVRPGSALAKAGLVVGDEITAINGLDITQRTVFSEIEKGTSNDTFQIHLAATKPEFVMTRATVFNPPNSTHQISYVFDCDKGIIINKVTGSHKPLLVGQCIIAINGEVATIDRMNMEMSKVGGCFTVHIEASDMGDAYEDPYGPAKTVTIPHGHLSILKLVHGNTTKLSKVMLKSIYTHNTSFDVKVGDTILSVNGISLETNSKRDIEAELNKMVVRLKLAPRPHKVLTMPSNPGELGIFANTHSDLEGILVTKVEEGKPGHDMGLRVGDVIIRIGGITAFDKSHDEMIHMITSNREQELICRPRGSREVIVHTIASNIGIFSDGTACLKNKIHPNVRAGDIVLEVNGSDQVEDAVKAESQSAYPIVLKTKGRMKWLATLHPIEAGNLGAEIIFIPGKGLMAMNVHPNGLMGMAGIASGDLIVDIDGLYTGDLTPLVDEFTECDPLTNFIEWTLSGKHPITLGIANAKHFNLRPSVHMPKQMNFDSTTMDRAGIVVSSSVGGVLQPMDMIVAINGKSVAGLTKDQALAIYKRTQAGTVGDSSYDSTMCVAVKRSIDKSGNSMNLPTLRMVEIWRMGETVPIGITLDVYTNALVVQKTTSRRIDLLAGDTIHSVNNKTQVTEMIEALKTCNHLILVVKQ